MILYHYTTAEGLRGIIKSKSIWASDYRFLNDAREFRYGLSIFDDIFVDRKKRMQPEAVEVLERGRHWIEVTSDFDFSLLIASFCEHDDLLSQWRGYNGALGYAIGLNGDWVQQNADEQKFHWGAAIYEPTEQQQVIHSAFNLLDSLLAEGRSSQYVKEEWWPHMLKCVARLKNKHFREEREWRLVKATDGWPPGICSRATPLGIIPYLPVRLDAKIINHPMFEPKNIGIERIVVGPALPDRQRKAVEALLASEHMRVEIVKSDIPYLPNGS